MYVVTRTLRAEAVRRGHTLVMPVLGGGHRLAEVVTARIVATDPGWRRIELADGATLTIAAGGEVHAVVKDAHVFEVTP